MNILITNDDGYRAKGIRVLTEIMKQFGDVTVIAPKHHQSGMSMAVSLGLKQLAWRELSEEEVDRSAMFTSRGDIPSGNPPARWSYLDATPASCVKFGLNTCFLDNFPDVVVSGINHGSNAASASCYSGTLGAALEAALNGIPAIGVSLDTLNPEADFSPVVKYFPGIFSRLMSSLPERKGIIYNVNFPDIPAGQIKGVRTGYQGQGRWIREFKEWDPAIYAKLGITPEMLGQSSTPKCEEGEKLYTMVGDFLDDPQNTVLADHLLIKEGFISVVAHNIDTTDYSEVERLGRNGMDVDF
ncbi:MAG: 5'/3'-nucleotidase SurE [Clostridium sp.]|nr:5'/3'-nucleotidase SurE [Bacteroides sp.]MCM1199212.1 5'/3'-nucleotidase SurE [Clostridium sp.]